VSQQTPHPPTPTIWCFEVFVQAVALQGSSTQEPRLTTSAARVHARCAGRACLTDAHSDSTEFTPRWTVLCGCGHELWGATARRPAPLPKNTNNNLSLVYFPLHLHPKPLPGGVFSLRMTFGEQYPEKPPRVRFTSEVFHPNVYSDGTLCMDIIQDQWSPIHNVCTLLTSIQSLLTDPNPASPANPEAAQLYTEDVKQYNRRVRRLAQKTIEG